MVLHRRQIRCLQIPFRQSIASLVALLQLESEAPEGFKGWVELPCLEEGQNSVGFAGSEGAE